MQAFGAEALVFLSPLLFVESAESLKDGVLRTVRIKNE